MKTATYLTLPLAAGKRYIRRDGSITPPLTGGPIWLEDLETKFIFEPNHPFVFDPSGSDLSDKDLVADYHETRDGRPVRILATDVKHPAHHPDQGAPMTCEAQKRGYVPVRVTQDANGWPVGFEGWLDPENNNRVWDADCTTYWFHHLNRSCERITPDPFPVGSVHTTRDGRKATIISTNLTSPPHKMLVLFSGPDGDDYAMIYKGTGRRWHDSDHPFDLIPPQTTITLTVPAHRVAELEAFANALR